MKAINTLIFLFAAFLAHAQMQYVSPVPNAIRQNPDRNIVIRPGEVLDAASLNASLFTITGSHSGKHDFNWILALDGKTINLNPEKPFNYDEKVTVTIKPGIRKTDGTSYEGYSFSFSIHRNYSPEEKQRLSEAVVKMQDDVNFNSLNAIQTNTTPSSSDFTITTNTTPAPGQTFFSNNTGTQKMRIIQNNGDSVYTQASSIDGWGFTLNHNNLITAYNVYGSFDMFDSNYVQIANFKVTNGYPIDLHEFQIFPDGHYYMLADDAEIVDMTVYNANYQPDATVSGSVIQEFDAHNNLIFEWNSFDHIDIPEAVHENLANSFIDYVHMNSIEEDTDGNIIVSCRHLDQINKINIKNGNFIWRLGGIKNQFTFTNDSSQFNYQHDARRLDNGNITLMDNNNWGSPNASYAKEYQLNEKKMKAKLVWSYSYPKVNGKYLSSSATGSVQRLSNGNTLIDWGLPPYTGGFPNFTEVDSNNNIVWELAYNGTPLVYRAHRYSWNPCSRPTDSRLSTTNITATSAQVNWNAATGAVKYNIQYHKQSAKKWKNKKVKSPNLSLTLTGLLPGTVYEWKMNTWCDATGTTQSALTAIKTFTTSPSKLESMIPDELPSITIYPNPASDLLNINFSSAIDQEKATLIQVMNTMGQIALEKKSAIEGNSNTLHLNVQSLTPGFYMMRLMYDGKEFETKFIKE